MLDCLLIWTEWPHLDATDWNNNNNNTANSGAVGGCNICTWTKTHSFDHPPTHKRLNNNPIAFILLMRVGETLMHPIQCQSFCLLFTKRMKTRDMTALNEWLSINPPSLIQSHSLGHDNLTRSQTTRIIRIMIIILQLSSRHLLFAR